jgi:hypothetical protein
VSYLLKTDACSKSHAPWGFGKATAVATCVAGPCRPPSVAKRGAALFSDHATRFMVAVVMKQVTGENTQLALREVGVSFPVTGGRIDRSRTFIPPPEVPGVRPSLSNCARITFIPERITHKGME